MNWLALVIMWCSGGQRTQIEQRECLVQKVKCMERENPSDLFLETELRVAAKLCFDMKDDYEPLKK